MKKNIEYNITGINSQAKPGISGSKMPSLWKQNNLLLPGKRHISYGVILEFQFYDAAPIRLDVSVALIEVDIFHLILQGFAQIQDVTELPCLQV